MKKVKLSLSAILAKLGADAPTNIPPLSEEPGEGRVTQSIRFPPQLRHWVASQADHLGISIQDFVSLTMKGVMVATDSPHTDELDTMAMRFFQLFESHNIGVADIPKFLPEGLLSRSDLQDTRKVINALDDAVISHLEMLFGVSGKWLKGQSDEIYTRRSFYKSLASILAEIVRFKMKTGGRVEVLFFSRSGVGLRELARLKASEHGSEQYEYIYVVLRLNRTYMGQDLTTYQLWDSLPWNYWRSRYYAKSLIYFCDKSQTYPSGLSFESDRLDELISGREMLNNTRREGKHWTVDELVWDDDRNTEREELDAIEEFFIEEKGLQYLEAFKHSYRIINRDEFLEGRQAPRFENDIS